MQIKIHRGTHQIGGCITEIKTKFARILVDMGAELPSAKGDAPSPLTIEGVTDGKPDCNAVLITHYHGDHVGMFESVLPQIPIYMGTVAKRIYETVQTTLKAKFDWGNPLKVRSFREYGIGKPLSFGDIKVTPYRIDHSAYDAYMLLIEAEGKRILHTGDFRMHGVTGNKMPAVFEKYCADLDVLITEGTMLSRVGETVISEHELGVQANRLLRENHNVFALCSATNIDTIAEFYRAARNNHRPFIICDNDFQGEILRIVTQYTTSPFYDFTGWNVYSYGKNLHRWMAERGFFFLGRANSATLRAIETFPDSLLIYAMWSGYLDETHPAFDAYKSNFMKSALRCGCKSVHLHTSGHASIDEIKQVCAITKAKTILPIHCERPEGFMELGLKSTVKLLRDGEIFTV